MAQFAISWSNLQSVKLHATNLQSEMVGVESRESGVFLGNPVMQVLYINNQGNVFGIIKYWVTLHGRLQFPSCHTNTSSKSFNTQLIMLLQYKILGSVLPKIRSVSKTHNIKKWCYISSDIDIYFFHGLADCSWLQLRIRVSITYKIVL